MHREAARPDDVRQALPPVRLADVTTDVVTEGARLTETKTACRGSEGVAASSRPVPGDMNQSWSRSRRGGRPPSLLPQHREEASVPYNAASCEYLRAPFAGTRCTTRYTIHGAVRPRPYLGGLAHFAPKLETIRSGARQGGRGRGRRRQGGGWGDKLGNAISIHHAALLSTWDVRKRARAAVARRPAATYEQPASHFR